MQLVSLFQCRMTRAHFILIFHDLFLLYVFIFYFFENDYYWNWFVSFCTSVRKENTVSLPPSLSFFLSLSLSLSLSLYDVIRHVNISPSFYHVNPILLTLRRHVIHWSLVFWKTNSFEWFLSSANKYIVHNGFYDNHPTLALNHLNWYQPKKYLTIAGITPCIEWNLLDLISKSGIKRRLKFPNQSNVFKL